ncbi:MAG TPA: ABC transporter ATP-binding protein, partial [Flavipsychrobacter sp.]
MSIANRISFFIKDIKRIWLLIWMADKRLAVLSIVLQLIQAVLPVFSLYYIKELIEALTSNESNSPESFYTPLIIFGVIQFFLAIIGQYHTYVNTIFGQKLTDYLSGIVLRKATDIDYEYYEQPAYHDTLHLAQQQSMQRAPGLLAIFNSVLLNSTSLLFLIIFFFTLKSLFALWFILLSLPLAFIKWRFGHSIVQQERRLVPWIRESNYIHNSLTGTSFAKEVRVLGFSSQFIEKFRRIRAYIFDEKRKLNAKLANFSLLAETLEIIVMIGLFVMLARSTFAGAITIGTFVIYIQGFQRMQTTSRNFLQSVVQALQQKDFLKDLFAFLDIELSSSKGRQLDFPVVGTGLSVRDISFTYPLTERVVLQGINIDCKPGNIIAIVGENGSGKSTLVKLLSKLYHVQSGSIQIGNVAISDIAEEKFRQNSIFLFQDYEKHFLTVKENIAIGTKGEIDDERI